MEGRRQISEAMKDVPAKAGVAGFFSGWRTMGRDVTQATLRLNRKWVACGGYCVSTREFDNSF